jgi:hypothetical protein
MYARRSVSVCKVHPRCAQRIVRGRTCPPRFCEEETGSFTVGPLGRFAERGCQTDLRRVNGSHCRVVDRRETIFSKQVVISTAPKFSMCVSLWRGCTSTISVRFSICASTAREPANRRNTSQPSLLVYKNAEILKR